MPESQLCSNSKGMVIDIHEQSGVIVRRFKGDVCFEDMIESWKQLLVKYPNLEAYKGILTSFLDADIRGEDGNMNVMVEFLKEHLDKLKDLRIAMVMDTPLVTNTIIMGERMKSLQIKPFSTEEAALQWIVR